MRNEPARYHVRVTSDTGRWAGSVSAFNKLDAAFHAGEAAGQAGAVIGHYRTYYIHQDRGLGCCQPVNGTELSK
jgi:hypothetical protein